MGERVAHLVTSKIIDFIEFDDDFAIAKTRAPADALNKTLAQSALRRVYNVTIVGVKRPGADFIYGQPDTMVLPGDFLIVAGATRDVEAFAGAT
jgi:trk system potassium uptake protein TrkA